MKYTTQLLPSQAGNLGIIQLNNPKALHALTLDMVESFHGVLKAWTAKDSSIRALWVEGGTKDTKRPIFCAGGDVKSIYEQQKENFANGIEFKPGQRNCFASDFFRCEYGLDHAIATSEIPQVSIWDGIVMGGGVGVSIHGKYRIATENTLFAMPETGIGLFPDVGGMYWLPRLRKRHWGTFLALTGHIIGPKDVLHAGIATHYVSSSKIPELKRALIDASSETANDPSDFVSQTLMSFHEHIDTSKSFLVQNDEEMELVFSGDRNPTLEAIIEVLAEKAEASNFCGDTLKKLRRMSPTSLKVTLEALKRGLNECETIGDDLAMEYRLSQAFMRQDSDFYEGIRAALVDKDKNPQWNPAKLEDVTSDIVESYFKPLGENLDWSIEDEDSKSKL